MRPFPHSLRWWYAPQLTERRNMPQRGDGSSGHASRLGCPYVIISTGFAVCDGKYLGDSPIA